MVQILQLSKGEEASMRAIIAVWEEQEALGRVLESGHHLEYKWLMLMSTWTTRIEESLMSIHQFTVIT